MLLLTVAIQHVLESAHSWSKAAFNLQLVQNTAGSHVMYGIDFTRCTDGQQRTQQIQN